MMTSTATQNEISHVPLVSKILDRLPKPEEKDMEEEEIANAYSKSDVISAVEARFSSKNKVSDSTDSDYVDGENEYEQEEKDLLDDEYDSQELESSNKDDESGLKGDFDEQLSEAIEHIQRLAAYDRDEIIINAMSVYREEYGEEISSKTLVDAFALVKLQLFGNDIISDDESDESQSDEEAELENEEEKQDLLENDDDEKELNVNEVEEEEEFDNMSEVEEDFAEAFEAIKLRAAVDQELLVNRICDTYVDFNEIEPEVNELSEIFSRIKLRFSQEAQDELFDSVDTVDEESEYELENESDDDENDSNYDPDKDDYNYENDYSEVTESDNDEQDDEE